MSYGVFMKKELRYIAGLIMALVLSLASSVESGAQPDPSFTHFWMVETQYNPAAAGNGPYRLCGMVPELLFASPGR